MIADLLKFLIFSVRAMMRIGMMAACRSVDSQFLNRRKRRFFFAMVLVCLARLMTEAVAMTRKKRQCASSLLVVVDDIVHGRYLVGRPLN